MPTEATPPVEPLPSAALYRHSDLSSPGFKTTKDLEDVETLVGQERALEAVRFAARMRARGYNLFVIGPKGSGKHTAVRRYLQERARNFPSPEDQVYVHNFADAHRPIALTLPTAAGPILARAMDKMIADLTATVPSVFEGEDYRLRRQAIDKSFAGRGEAAFKIVAEEAAKHGLALLRTEHGLAVAPVEDGKPMPQERFAALPQTDRERLQKAILEVQGQLQEVMRHAPILERERQETIGALDQSVAEALIQVVVDEARAALPEIPVLSTWLDAMRADLVTHIQLFARDDNPVNTQSRSGPPAPGSTSRRRYEVNVLVTHEVDRGAPVVMEDHPTLGRLIGRIEHRAQQGAMITDFTLIRHGALHAANGGYLLLDAQKLVTQPHAWDALKRALYSGKITIEGPDEAAATALAVSIQPSSVPLDVKVVLFGDHRIHLLLSSMDADFGDLFKVAADFDEVLARDPEHDQLYARLIATIQRRERLRPFDRKAVERVIEHCSRLVSDAEKLTTRVGRIANVLREADYVGRERNHKVIRANDVEDALDAQRRRVDRIERQAREQILRETVLIYTEGEAVGQVNGLSVLQIGAHAFGRPTRITARVRVGTGRVIDIEREVDLGGPLHSKGVLILQGYLASRYAISAPTSLQASLVFEQSYGGVDGDSASSTELYALLSALSDIPIRQGLAVTGSINQMGAVQAIGGVNEKIEGFFDLCEARGLTGDQGVLIPAANTVHLMLKSEVRAAVDKGAFRIWTVRTVAEGIALLTGQSAEVVDTAVEARLQAFAEARRRFSLRAED
ncbi:MAG: AAA family ATPase [Alphaproteobacteria bacterium]|nr:AAA family ATPase [Alphaproteobacteria bacterium]